ncbi:MAG: hypothetical protein JWM57_1425 [Phycisphaerales bacterium]|nr:hypothetical protein [Phycisphaerales bacterium]
MQNFPRLSALALLALTAVARADVNAALDALHDSGANLQSLSADISLRTVSGDLGDDETKSGTFLLQKKPDGDTRVRASFTERRSGTKIFKDRRDYVLAGPDLIDRDYANKKQTTRQVRQPGQKLDLFKLGEGPFPLPVGQARDDVLKDFDVEELPNNDKAILATIKLSPKPETEMADKFKTITVKIDRQTKLPTEIKTVDKQQIDTNTATLKNIRVNDAIGDKAFDLDPIDPKDWNLVSGK